MKMLFKIVKWIVTIFLSLVLLLVAFQKFSKNTVALGNIYIFQVVSESMLPEYHVGDIIVVKKVKASSLKIGDDVTYLGTSRVVSGLTITHRIVDINVDEEGKRHFITKGVSNMIEDTEIMEENIYGKVIYHTILFSFVGRLMTNIYIYYFLFISVGVSFSYELITSFFIKDKSKDEVLKEIEEAGYYDDDDDDIEEEKDKSVDDSIDEEEEPTEEEKLAEEERNKAIQEEIEKIKKSFNDYNKDL